MNTNMEHPQELIVSADVQQALDTAATGQMPGYYVCGPEGVGKKLVAYELAARLLNTNREQLHAHPDLVTLRPEEGKAQFRIESLTQELEEHATTRPVQAAKRVILIPEADRLNDACMNMLLKWVEEAHVTVYIFVTQQAGKLLPTLRSRLAPIRLSRLPKRTIKESVTRITTQKGVAVSDEELQRAVDQSRGCIGRALRVLMDPDQISMRSACERVARAFTQGKPGEAIAAIDELTSAIDKQKNPALWPTSLQELMEACEQQLAHYPHLSHELGEAITRAWRAIGSSGTPPRLFLEWSAVPKSTRDTQESFSYLTREYL